PNSVRVARFIGQGSVPTVECRSGRATLLGPAVPLDGADGPEGLRQAMFRPADLAVVAPDEAGALRGSVTSSLSRGGPWEARIDSPGLDEPFLVHTNAAVRVGDAIGLKLRGGWLLPQASPVTAARAPHRAAAAAPEGPAAP
ncbi:MAG: hypothetical protein AAF914_13445, partial [Pseudomonadota bacterium]